jgi:hypothetical protein
MSQGNPTTPPGEKNLAVATAVLLGILVGLLAIFEKPIIKAASDFFSSC